jgi:cob(I)alamin adenosyltransferase
MRIDRVYTRAGDDGRVAWRRSTLAKIPCPRGRLWHARRSERGKIGVALLYIEDARAKDILLRVQNDLFDLGADLSRPEREYRKAAPLRASERQVTWLEETIDSLNASLAPLESFVLPGGSPAAAHLHHARTVVRRAERYMTEIAYQEPVNPTALRYANRLSDLMFVLGRYLNENGLSDRLWQPGLHH